MDVVLDTIISPLNAAFQTGMSRESIYITKSELRGKYHIYCQIMIRRSTLKQNNIDINAKLGANMMDANCAALR